MNPRTFLALHVVFGRACGATLTTLNAKKIALSAPDCLLSQCSNRLSACENLLSGAPLTSLSAGIDNQDAPSSCQRLTRGCLDAAEAVWRRPRAARTTKKLLKSLQKRCRERLRERSEPQDAPGEPQTTKNLKNTMVFHHFRALNRNLSTAASGI